MESDSGANMGRLKAKGAGCEHWNENGTPLSVAGVHGACGLRESACMFETAGGCQQEGSRKL